LVAILIEVKLNADGKCGWANPGDSQPQGPPTPKNRRGGGGRPRDSALVPPARPQFLEVITSTACTRQHGFLSRARNPTAVAIAVVSDVP
jgi:hypothetical protein